MNEVAQAPAPGPRRLRLAQIGWLLAGLFACAGIGALAASLLLTTAVLNNDLAEQIRRTTGFVTVIEGGARFSLLPQPHIEIEQISFANPKAALRIYAERFTGYLRVLPLLVGRVEVGHAILYQPKMIIDVDDRPMTPDSEIGRAARAKPASPEAAAVDRAQLAIVDFVDGTARLHHRTAAQDLFIDDINVRVDWRSLDASATLTGGVSFRDVPMQVKAWFAQPVELLRGGRSATTFQLDSDVVKIMLSGELSAAQHFQYSGSLGFSAPSLRRVARLAGIAFTKHGRFADFDLRCDANINSDSATFTNLRLELDGNDYEGTLAVQAVDRAEQISGTLATSRLDATPFLEGLPQPRSASGQWSDAPLELADLGFANLDLRLSATQLSLHDIALKDAALSVLTRPGFIDLALGEASSNGGTIRGRLSLQAAGKTLDMRASASATGLDVRPMLRGGIVRHPLEGALSGSLIVESKGGSFAELMRHMSGHAEADLANGEIVGLDLATALRAGAAGPLLTRGDPNSQTTNFDAAHAGVEIRQGIAKLVEGRLHSDALAVSFGGSADLGDRSLDFWALAHSPLAAAQPDEAAAPLMITLKGPWEQLQIGAERQHAGLATQPERPAGAPPAFER